MTGLRIRDLGPLLVEDDDQTRRVPAGTLSTALALLAVHAGRRVGADALVDAIWGDRTTARSLTTLDSHILRLRRVLEPNRRSRQAPTVLVTETGGFRLVARPEQIDSLRFARFARLAVEAADLLAQGAPDRALRRIEEALGSCAAVPSASPPMSPGPDRPSPGWRSCTRRSARRASARSWRSAPPTAPSPSSRRPWRTIPSGERLWAYRMTAYWDAGRRADALSAYARARTTLIDELGLEPGPELRALHAALLADEQPASREPLRRPGNVHLPTVRTRLLGRDAEVAELTRLVTARPLVTLTGSRGGCIRAGPGPGNRHRPGARPDGPGHSTARAVAVRRRRRLLRAGIAESTGGTDDTDLLSAALAQAAGPVITAGDVTLAEEVAAAARALVSGRDDPGLDVLIRHTEFVAPLLTRSDPDMLARLQALHADARKVGNHYTGWVAAVSVAQLILHRGPSDEALVWAREAVADSVAMGMRENHIVVEVLGCALALNGDSAVAARAFAVAEDLSARAGIRWPTFEVTEGLLDTVGATIGRAGSERARADAAALTLPDLATVDQDIERTR